MSDRSDYIRCVSGPLEASLRKENAQLRRALSEARVHLCGAVVLADQSAVGFDKLDAPGPAAACRKLADDFRLALETTNPTANSGES